MKKIVFFAFVCALIIAVSGCTEVCEGPHNEVVDEAVAPTCDKTGLTEGKHCADCKTVIVKQEVVPVAHEYADEIVRPSMLEGKHVKIKCKLCGYEIKEKFSAGIEITPDDETMTCIVKGMGSCNDREINIAPVISGYKVVGIAKRAFSGEKRITSIKIPDSVTTIGDNAFANCSKLVKVDLPAAVTKLGAHAFSENGRLKTVIIPDGIIEIGTATFFSCTSLEAVVIPYTVKRIGMQAFSSSNLKTIFFGGTEKQWESVKLEYGNGPANSAVTYYYSEKKPSASGVYWHFVDGVPTVW